eukprot:6170511-Prymnesium_polylepis.1
MDSCVIAGGFTGPAPIAAVHRVGFGLHPIVIFRSFLSQPSSLRKQLACMMAELSGGGTAFPSA